MNAKKTILTALLAIFLLALPAVAAPTLPLAEVENQGDTLVFYPHVEFAQLILTVAGPCAFEYKQVVSEGELVFRLDETTIDGAYTYDLVRMEEVDPGIVKVLLQARQEADPETPKQLCRDGKLPPPPTSQSEGFQVSRGEIIYDPETIEKVASGDSDGTRSNVVGAMATSFPEYMGANGQSRVPNKDIPHYDDVIIDGSLCVGFDCVVGESFGFDTIRVKENNLRIKFDDTSVAASFPRNDWQLTANDSANGGASKFSIDDISGNRTPFTVEANARSHSLYVDDGGRIGSRTSTPSTEIHTIDGDTPTLRLQQDGSSGFAPQTWDVAGNETNFFIRDVTNGSQLPFRIRPDAPTSSIFIDVDGDVGMGTASPDSDLEVERTDGSADLTVTANGPARLNLQNTDQSTWSFNSNAAGNMAISTGSGEFLLAPTSGNLTITGTLVTGGGGTCDPGPCDGTFTDYTVESIEEHSTYMWENSHLWGVGPTPDGAPVQRIEEGDRNPA